MIKVIAVDMDGTFLDDNKQYNRHRFLAQYQAMQQQKIRFVVASGNQYAHLCSFFPTIAKEITFIAENGALLVDRQQIIFNTLLSNEFLENLMQFVQEEADFVGCRLILSGEQSAYILQSTPAIQKKQARFFYEKLTEVACFSKVSDKIYKVAFHCPLETMKACERKLQATFKTVKVLTSGHQAIDMVNEKAGKEKGIMQLKKLWNLKDDEVAVFGDNMNDIEMIKSVKYGYAMDNAREELKKLAFKVIGNNNQQAVLDEMDRILAHNTQRA